MSLEERLATVRNAVATYIDDPRLIDDLELEQQLDIAGAIQHVFELQQALVRQKHSEHSWQFMEAHADVNYWKNKLMNLKVKARLEIAGRERGI